MGGAPTTNVNNLTAVHQTSTGLATCGPPDVCLTPNPTPGGAPVPVPYPNVATSMDLVGGTQTVSVDGSSVAIRPSVFVKSTGDEPGVIGGVVSGRNMSEAEFLSFSPTVSMEGEQVCRLTDQMTMNARNTVIAGGVQQPPLPPPTPIEVPPPEAPKVCRLISLQAMCGHSNRNYLASTKKDSHARIQVIVSEEAEELTFDFQADCGLTGGTNCTKLHIRGPDGKDTVDKTRKLKIEPDDSLFSLLADWFEFARYVLSKDAFPERRYTLYTTGCQGVEGASMSTGEFITIDAYPAVKWSGEVSFGYKFEKYEVKDGEVELDANDDPVQGFDDGIPPALRKRVLHQLKREATWELDGEVSGQYGKHTFETKLSDLAATAGYRKGKGAKANSDPFSRKLFSATQGTLNSFTKTLASFSTLESTKFEIRWPKIKINGSVELKEAKHDYYVYYEGKFFIGADPLIGAEVSVDILDWLIIAISSAVIPGAGPMIGKLLVRAKSRVKSGLTVRREMLGDEQKKLPLDFKADIGIVFTMGGDVGGGIGWIFDDQGVKSDPAKMGIQAGIDLQLEAYIKVEAKVFIIKAAAGVSLSIKSADGKSPSRVTGIVSGNPKQSKRGKPRTGDYYDAVGMIQFNGLGIHYAVYAEISGEGSEAGPSTHAGSNKAEAPSRGPRTSHLRNKWEEEGGMLTILEPWTWPKPHTPMLEAM